MVKFFIQMNPIVRLPIKDKLEVLSDREKDIIICITKGMNNKEIADYLIPFCSHHNDPSSQHLQ